MGKQPRTKQTAWTRFQQAQTIREPNGSVGQMWVNSRYTVIVTPAEKADPRAPNMVHLSIRRNDREPIRDWRDLQRIKNDLVGPECEAIELFPAESRLVDTANQFHLWAFTDPTFRLGLGWNERLVVDAGSSPSGSKSKQRAFDPEIRPADTLTPTQAEELARVQGLLSATETL